ncbi:MAG: hypothetical protein RML46_04545 [Anaerolineae bacterium]|nr:hypothetical protein [Anaerolineae bacterium]
MSRQKITVLAAVLLCSLLLTGVALASGPPTIDWRVIGGGGGRVQAGTYILDGTVGQAVVGRAVGSTHDLCSGFWCGLAGYPVYLPLVLRNY